MEQIIDVNYVDEMEQSYLDYSLSVLVGRAIPSVYDGLKPVHRRVLYSMRDLNLKSSGGYKKSAKTSGQCLGAYHPHSDSACYESLVFMSQDFRLNYPTVDVHGNGGFLEDPNSYAHQRYTECKLQKFSEDILLCDLNSDVVDFMDNYDQTEKEPVVLPSKIPLLLLNGTTGIAVGMTTNIPGHNLSELIDTEIALIKNREMSLNELMKYISGPDFPTGGICEKRELFDIYQTGKGKLKIRGKVQLEELKGGKRNLVITEIPYTMLGATEKFLCDVIDLIENKTLTGISDVLNQTDKDGVRMVLELKKDADATEIEKILYKKTKLEDTFPVSMLAVVNKTPKLMGLKEILNHHINFRYECETRKYKYLLTKEKDKQEIQEGLIKACDVIDLIIEILRGSKSVKDAKECLMYGEISNINLKTKASQTRASKLAFTERQAQAILDMRLQKLIGLEVAALIADNEQTKKNIIKYEDILNNKESMKKVIIEDLERIKKEYGRPRRTVITDIEDVVIEEKKIAETPVVVLMDRFGYTRTVDTSVYEKNKAAADSENKYIIHCMNTSKLCLFTDVGKMHQIKVLDLPHGNFRAKGQPIDNVSKYNSAEENMLTIMSEDELKGKRLLFSTQQGMLKQVDTSEFIITKKTIAATKLNDGDLVISVQIIDEKDMAVLQTRDGYFLKFSGSEIPEKKKGAVGVRGIKLQKDDILEHVHLYKDGNEKKIIYKEKELTLNRLKTAKRDGVGTKQK